MTFTINREEKRNAVNDEVMNGLREVITYIQNHDDVRFLVVTGAGKNLFVQEGIYRSFMLLKQKMKPLGC